MMDTIDIQITKDETVKGIVSRLKGVLKKGKPQTMRLIMPYDAALFLDGRKPDAVLKSIKRRGYVSYEYSSSEPNMLCFNLSPASSPAALFLQALRSLSSYSREASYAPQ
ncbi:hypothetical protein KY345_07010 [Candidatus Woesearchaeota archaeon]|nr:hypothetical protein [Candidatus Woesearchaeota archaeon]